VQHGWKQAMHDRVSNEDGGHDEEGPGFRHKVVEISLHNVLTFGYTDSQLKKFPPKNIRPDTPVFYDGTAHKGRSRMVLDVKESEWLNDSGQAISAKAELVVS
jgi:hypothetical protein